MSHGVGGHQKLQHAQHHADHHNAGAGVLFLAVESLDDGHDAVGKEPNAGHVEQDGIVHGRGAGDHTAEDAQDEACNGKVELLVVALFGDRPDNAENAVEEEQNDDAGADAQEGQQRGEEHADAADDRQDTHDREQNGQVVAALAFDHADDDRVNTGLNKVEADENAEADSQHGGVDRGVDGGDQFQHAQDDAQHHSAGLGAALLVFDGGNDGQDTVDEEPAGSHIEQHIVAHGSSARNKKTDEAQDQADRRKDKLFVVALFGDPADDAEDAVDKEQRDDEIARADEGDKRRRHQGEAPDDHQNAHDNN